MDISEERTDPDLSDQQLWNETKARYIFASAFTKNKKVLDAGCGNGYGSDIIASNCKYVLGIDNSENSISYANSHYRKHNLEYKIMSLPILEMQDKIFDVVVALEVIEHVSDQEKSIIEFKRVLQKNGLLIITTPNQKEHPGESFNPFHVHEMDYDEFRGLLQNYFKNVKILTFNFFLGMAILPRDQPELDKIEIDKTFLNKDIENEPPFFIGLCSDSKIDLRHIHRLYPFTFSRLAFFDYLKKMQDIAKKDYSEPFILSLIRYFIDNKKNYDVSLLLLEKLYEDNPKNPNWNYFYAFCLHILKKDLKKALTHYNLALEYGFDKFWIFYNRGLLHKELGDTASAKSDLEQAMKLKNDLPELIEALKKINEMENQS